MGSGTRSRLDVIGGGYDHLAPVSRMGARRLAEAPVILHYAPLAPATLRRANAAAELVPWTDAEHLVQMLDSPPPGAAVLMGDGVACPRLLGAMTALAAQGTRIGYYPALPLVEAARCKAGFPDPGKASVRRVAAEDAGSTGPGGAVTAVGFDGRVLWPPRTLPRDEVAGLARHLPPGGLVFLVEPSRGATTDLCGGLFGRGVVVTRAAEQADEMGMALLAHGATPFYFPTIVFAEPPRGETLDRALATLPDFDGVIFTSVNTVSRFLVRLAATGRDCRALAGLEILAVGEKTAGALRERGLMPDEMPRDYRAEGLLEVLGKRGVYGRRFLLPRAEAGREILPEGIRALGGEVEMMPLYRTVAAEPDTDELARLHRAGLLDAVTFTSGSTFEHFIGILGEAAADGILRAAAIGCIGPVVAAAVRQAGYEPAVVPPVATVDELVAALEEHFAKA